MTKQEFLSASLPYGLNMYHNDGSEYFVETLDGIYRGVPMIGCAEADGYVPVIRNISDLTKECVQADYNGGKPFVPIKIILNEITESWAKVGLNYPNDETGLYKDIVSNINSCEYWIIKLLLKWHFDLITEDCEKVYVTEEFNPYK